MPFTVRKPTAERASLTPIPLGAVVHGMELILLVKI